MPYPTALLRSAYLYAVRQFSRKEIIGFGLFVPSIAARIPILISKERSLAKLARFNPPEYQHLTESKDEFYTICRQKRLPIPETYGWSRDGRRYDADGGLIDGDSAWGATYPTAWRKISSSRTRMAPTDRDSVHFIESVTLFIRRLTVMRTTSTACSQSLRRFKKSRKSSSRSAFSTIRGWPSLADGEASRRCASIRCWIQMVTYRYCST